MIKLGIIGLGRMGGFHASICATLPNVQLIGIADPSEEIRAKVTLKNIIKSADYCDWINEVDAVIIAVPTALHYPIAKDCLERKKHVLIEKPITKTIEQAQELFSIAQKNNLALHVGHVERFNGAVQELKKIIDKPYLVESHRMGPFQPRVQDDSIILDLMIHDLDIILSLINSPVKSQSVHGSRIHTKLCDIANTQLQFENGVIANVTSSRASQIKKRTMCIHQEHEYIELDFTTQDITIYRQANTSVQIGSDRLRYKQAAVVEHVFVYKDNPLKLEIQHFIDAIKQGQHLSNPAQDIGALQITLELEKQLSL